MRFALRFGAEAGCDGCIIGSAAGVDTDSHEERGRVAAARCNRRDAGAALASVPRTTLKRTAPRVVSPGRRWCPGEESQGATPRPRPGRPAGLSLTGGARQLVVATLSQGADNAGTPVWRWSREPVRLADIHGAVETRPFSSAAQLRLPLLLHLVKRALYAIREVSPPQ